MKNNLKKFREKAGLSQRALGKAANLPQGRICDIENGFTKIYPTWKERISKALNVPEIEIFPEQKDRRGSN